MPRRRREASRGAEYSPQIHASLPDAQPIRRSPQCIVRKEKALDEAAHYLYGCSFQEFLDAAYNYAYDHGYRVGYKEGRAAGRRAAKGLPEARKKRGRPPRTNESLMSLLAHTVQARKRGESVKDAVRHFLRVMRAGVARERKKPDNLPTDQEAIRAYYRHRKKSKNPLF
jgi:hypothetical protein